jgi:hypothetical protein
MSDRDEIASCAARALLSRSDDSAKTSDELSSAPTPWSSRSMSPRARMEEEIPSTASFDNRPQEPSLSRQTCCPCMFAKRTSGWPITASCSLREILVAGTGAEDPGDLEMQEMMQRNPATTSLPSSSSAAAAALGNRHRTTAADPSSASLYPASEQHALLLLELCDSLDTTCAQSLVQRMLEFEILPSLIDELTAKLRSVPNKTRALVLRVLRDCISHAGHAEAAASLDWERLSTAVANSVVQMRICDSKQLTSLSAAADLITTVCLRALYELITTNCPQSLCGISGSDRQALVQIYLDEERKRRFWNMQSYVCYAVLRMCNVRALETLREPSSQFSRPYLDLDLDFDSDSSAGDVLRKHTPCDLSTDLWMFLAPSARSVDDKADGPGLSASRQVRPRFHMK